MSTNSSLTNLTTTIDSNFIILERVRLIVKFYIWPLMVIFGLTGNILSILVLTRRRLIRTSTNNYLTILAAFDSCYLILTLLLNFGSHPTFSKYSLTQTILFVLRPLADFSSNTATWLIVCFTLERTLAVTKPIYAKRTCSVRRSRHLICTVLVICFLVTTPTYFERHFLNHPLHSDNDPSMNSTLNNENESIQRQNAFLRFHRLYLVFICIFIIWIPLILLCVCNSILIWYVHRSRRFGNDFSSTVTYDSCPRSSVSTNQSDFSANTFSKSSFSSSSSPSSLMKNSYSCHLRRHNHSFVQKRKVTIVLIFCLCVALLLWTPQSLSLTYETLIESYEQMSNERRIVLLIFNNFANLFLCINASIDFILYCFLSENFARTCKQIIFRQCSNYRPKVDKRLRFISFDRTSLILTNPTIHPHHQKQQQQSLNEPTTQQYYSQFTNNCGIASTIKIDLRSKKCKKNISGQNGNHRSGRTLFHGNSMLQPLQSKLSTTTQLETSISTLGQRKSDECQKREDDPSYHTAASSFQTLNNTTKAGRLDTPSDS